MYRFRIKMAIGASAALMLLLSGTALAYTGETESTDKPDKSREAAKMRLEGAKLKACENREKAINNTLDRLAKRGERRLNVYSTVFERVQAFYTKKGLSVGNYSQLVADVNAKKSAAQAAVDKLKSGQVTFSCGGNDPKAVAGAHKDKLKTEIKALQDYHQSIRNLIAAIKAANASARPTTGVGTQ